MIVFFGEDEFQDVMNDKDSGSLRLAIKDAKENDMLLKSMLDYMIHHRDKPHITFKGEDEE